MNRADQVRQMCIDIALQEGDLPGSGSVRKTLARHIAARIAVESLEHEPDFEGEIAALILSDPDGGHLVPCSPLVADGDAVGFYVQNPASGRKFAVKILMIEVAP